MANPPSAGHHERPPWHLRMRGRDPRQSFRASTPLELLFDLIFVVAAAAVVREFGHAIAEGHALDDLGSFLFVFAAIWWAWVNFTWFASAYDTDDFIYRAFTVVQMAGALVLAAGVPAAFAGDPAIVTIGYLIMRIGLVAQWVRAAIEHPQRRSTTLLYAIGTAVIQAGWIGRLALPEAPQLAVALVLGIADLTLPIWAERPGATPWHGRHIAERYGLFVIILLGESVLAATDSVQSALTTPGALPSLVLLGVAGLLLIVGLWWLYFVQPAEAVLAARVTRSALSEAFLRVGVWGYGHYVLFGSLAAVGAGLEAAVLSLADRGHADHAGLLAALAVAVAVAMLAIWLLYVPRFNAIPLRLLLPSVGVVLLAPLTADAIGVAGGVAVMAAAVTAVLVGIVIRDERGAQPSTRSAQPG